MAIWRDIQDETGAVIRSERPCGHYCVWREYQSWLAYYDPEGRNWPTVHIGRAEGLSAAKVQGFGVGAMVGLSWAAMYIAADRL
jgi:hypothetical protein